MRKEMFNHEINILRDTYRRLIRRQAKTNLIKLTKKTHPADLATLFRHFSLEEQIEIFTLMNEIENEAKLKSNFYLNPFIVNYDNILTLELAKKITDLHTLIRYFNLI